MSQCRLPYFFRLFAPSMSFLSVHVLLIDCNNTKNLESIHNMNDTIEFIIQIDGRAMYQVLRVIPSHFNKSFTIILKILKS